VRRRRRTAGNGGTTSLGPMRDPRQEHTLVARLQAGDETALAEVYRRLGPVVYGLCHRITASSPAAEELCRQAFVELWQDPGRFRSDTSVETSLTTRAHQLAVQWCRQQGTHGDKANELTGAAESSPILRTAINALPTDQRRALTLAYFGGRTYREVAATMSISEVAAKAQLRMALSQLTHYLPTEGMNAWT
jgi:RNA polymerase sigma-70 factor (ECF subfamily)